ncbi:hypothetical protein [Acidocella sp.]|uniref:hypothetical protein n=1 Tax=Acidocella sp. TaxID=50710 RepID=UPI002F4147B7
MNRRKASFCEQKKAKNFMNLGYGRYRRHRPWPSIIKVFAPLFSKSGRFLLFMPRRPSAPWHRSRSAVSATQDRINERGKRPHTPLCAVAKREGMPYLLHRSMSMALLQDVSSLNLAVLRHRLFLFAPKIFKKAMRVVVGVGSKAGPKIREGNGRDACLFRRMIAAEKS